ncbi:hypothetical protein [Beijerinckia mobilis]|uniref:hypothetical protein n=1 Tax=Beijerinckia mobilis TaxID=231434 RepID=UPI001AEBB63F|nr:hypothetical protein [Beijerinckia mobilis]
MKHAGYSNRSYLQTMTRQFLVPALFVALGISTAVAQIFSSSSAWNTPISKKASYSTIANASGILMGLDTWYSQNQWTIPSYTATQSDSLHPLLYNADAWSKVYTNEWLRFGNSAAVEQTILASSSNSFPFPGNVYSSTSTTEWVLPSSYNKTVNPSNGDAFQFYFNSTMTPATGSDGHMAVAQPEGSVVETYSTIVLSTGQIVALSYSVTSPSQSSLGDGWQNGQTASMLPMYAGLFCDNEIDTGIKHAMAITVPAKLLTPKIDYPAFAFDRGAMTSNPPYSGNIPMGGRLAIPRSVSIISLGLLTQEGKAIAEAAISYGFIVVDQGGNGLTIRVSPTCSSQKSLLHTWNWDLQNDLNTIAGQLRYVKPK